jgi:hypothetical protein
MVEGRATVDREHFMTSHPPTPGSGNVLTPLDGLRRSAEQQKRPRRFPLPAIATDNATTGAIVFPFTVAWSGVEKAQAEEGERHERKQILA